jgi:hypothetical protein
MAQGQIFRHVASAPSFVISAPNIAVSAPGFPAGLAIRNLGFQQLDGITSHVKVEQYRSVDHLGINHTRQFGTVEPPQVKLKRGVDHDLTLWCWHAMAVLGLPLARGDVTLEIYGPGSPSDPAGVPMLTLTLQSAWCAEINISSAKAGEGLVTEDVVIACDAIVPGDG